MLQMFTKDKYKVIISSRFHKEIEEQLRENNIVDYGVFSIKNDKMYYPSCELVINPYAVSYTHLDVYKRQYWERATIKMTDYYAQKILNDNSLVNITKETMNRAAKEFCEHAGVLLWEN